jgi:hypothetical protein
VVIEFTFSRTVHILIVSSIGKKPYERSIVREALELMTGRVAAYYSFMPLFIKNNEEKNEKRGLPF